MRLQFRKMNEGNCKEIEENAEKKAKGRGR